MTVSDVRSPSVSRLGTLAVCVLLFYSVWASYFYFNAAVVDRHGEKTMFRDAVKNFFKSQLWKRMKVRRPTAVPGFRCFRRALAEVVGQL